VYVWLQLWFNLFSVFQRYWQTCSTPFASWLVFNFVFICSLVVPKNAKHSGARENKWIDTNHDANVRPRPCVIYLSYFIKLCYKISKIWRLDWLICFIRTIRKGGLIGSYEEEYHYLISNSVDRDFFVNNVCILPWSDQN
jgi:hypothetical protein